nr:uncharacterized protein LOC119170836 [Rhipicephalus microplus]
MFVELAPRFAMSFVCSTDSFEPTVVSPTTGVDCAQQDCLKDLFQAGQPPDVHMVVSPLILCDDDFFEDGSNPRKKRSVNTSDVTFRVGDRFASFVELEKAVAAYSSRHSVQLWKRDARTIDAARKRVGNIASKMSEHLKYQCIKYCCIHGGKKFTSTATGRSSSTFKHDCGFHIYVVATKDGANLEVRSVCLWHTNHAVSSEPLSEHTPQRRKVGPGFKHIPAAHNIPSTEVPLSDEIKKPDPLLIDNENINLYLSSNQKHHYKPELHDGASDGLAGSETLFNDNVKARAPAPVRLAAVLSDNAKSEPILSSHQKDHRKNKPLPIDNGEDELILSSHEMHEKAAAVAGKIARILSGASMPKFQRRLEVLEALLRDWSCDDEVAAGNREDNQCIASPCFKPAEV